VASLGAAQGEPQAWLLEAPSPLGDRMGRVGPRHEPNLITDAPGGSRWIPAKPAFQMLRRQFASPTGVL